MTWFDTGGNTPPHEPRLTAAQIISRALYVHQWTTGDGVSDVPEDECDCCAVVVLKALNEAGYQVWGPPGSARFTA